MNTTPPASERASELKRQHFHFLSSSPSATRALNGRPLHPFHPRTLPCGPGRGHGHCLAILFSSPLLSPSRQPGRFESRAVPAWAEVDYPQIIILPPLPPSPPWQFVPFCSRFCTYFSRHDILKRTARVIIRVGIWRNLPDRRFTGK